MVARVVGSGRRDARVLVGPETGDDAGVFLHEGRALVATVDFITPVCDEPRRFGRVAAANSLSDVFAMGGRPLFALNLCCIPEGVPPDAVSEILAGGQSALDECGAALLGGHTVVDRELKFGLAVVGAADPSHLLTLDKAKAGDRLVLSKPLGTGAVVNAFKHDEMGAAALEPVLVEMERLNAVAARLALANGAHACTDVTGFGLVGHALNMARGSKLVLRITYDKLPVHDAFWQAVRRGVSTRLTAGNRESAADEVALRRQLLPGQQEILFDPQTSGGLLVALPAHGAESLVGALKASGHRAAEIGEVVAGEPKVEIV